MSLARRIQEMNNEAYVARRSGDMAAAERAYRAMLAEVLADGADAPDALRSDVHHRVAAFLRDTGRMEEAEAFARQAIAWEERAGRAAILANHRMFLSDLLARRGELREALEQAERALEKQTESLGPEHRETKYYASVVASLRARITSS
jgi:hypothetical protein